MMKMLTKTLLATALTTAFAAPVLADEAVTVYGKLNVTAQSNDVAGESETTIQSNASRLGVKGGFDLGHNIEAFYTIEYEVDTNSDSKNNFEARNQFVGLRGDFGAVSLGRNDTMLKKSQGKVDQFGDLSGDIKSLFKGENRMAQTATYLTPSISNFKAGVTYVAKGDSAQKEEDGYSLAGMYGDAKLKKTPVFVSVAYDSKVYDSKGKGYDVLRATAQVKVVGLKLGAMYQKQEPVDTHGSQSGYLASAAYDIDAITLKGQYQKMDDKGSSWSLGGDYRLAKPTKLMAFYTKREMDASGDKMATDDSYFGVGIEHKF